MNLKNNYRQSFINVCLLSIFIFSCGERKSRSEDISDLTLARRFQNEGKHSKSIYYYEKSLTENDDPNVKLELTSAYASRAGIDVFSLYPILKDYIFKKPFISLNFSEDEEKEKEKPDSFYEDNLMQNLLDEKMAPTTRELFKRIYIYSRFINNHLPIFVKIPNLSTDQRFDLLQAMNLCDEESSKLARDDNKLIKKFIFYKEVLAHVLIINYLKDAFPQKANDVFSIIVCNLKYDQLQFANAKISRVYEILASNPKLSKSKSKLFTNNYISHKELDEKLGQINSYSFQIAKKKAVNALCY
ncbi:hypothetical protein N9N67_00575 [Bacteriovoracaceae bacterium]|nr:hypothetical protein [Bacteriovoracaceae bacterium]